MSYKGLIIVPHQNAAQEYISWGRYVDLFKMICRAYPFRIIEATQIDVKSIVEDIVIILKAPEYHSPDLLTGIAELSETKVLISYFTDIHIESGNTETALYLENMHKVLARSDYILCPYKSMFEKCWGKYINKLVFFPQYANYFVSKLNPKADMRCILSGKVDEWYPLRKQIANAELKCVDMLQHPGYNISDANIKRSGLKVRGEYTQLLSNYFCGIATPGLMGYVTAKYFEIPASGALLLASSTPDLKQLGFKPNVNYVNITQDNFKTVITNVIKNPNKYQKIRENGHRLVLDSHLLIHRFELLGDIIDEATKKL